MPKIKMNQALAYACVVIGASCWGIVGLFVQQLYASGFTPWQVVTIRLTISSLILFPVLFILFRQYLKIDWKDIPYFFILGVFSIALFNWCYFAVMERSSVAIAVVFVYTSPVFAALIARILYREKLTLQKNLAIIFTVAGCALAIEFIPIGGITVTLSTVLLGLLAGLFCSSYSIIGKHVSRAYHPVTITFYAMICGSVFMIPTSQIWKKTEMLLTAEIWMPIMGISVISTILAYVLFTLGLSYVESSKAAILSSAELIISVLVSIYILNESLTFWQGFGFIFVVASVVLTIFSFKKRASQIHSMKTSNKSLE
ncbi:DMT family transporter [Salipaludibacillus sp. CF4.18]|uniref:DMT family transporter n=1 Tax=Salipaludibacillus sp. CF4.18 TaxID=3373081 RepID=UPI003EE56FD6